MVRLAGATLGRRASRGQFPSIGLAYEELPALDSALISLATGHGPLPTQYISMLARTTESTHRDRAALTEAFEARDYGTAAYGLEDTDERVLDFLLAGRIHQADVPAQRHGHNLSLPHIGIAMSAPPGLGESGLADSFIKVAQVARPLIRAGEGLVMCLLPAGRGLAADHERVDTIRHWQAQLCATFGRSPSGIRRPLVARQAYARR
jgi:hypothetical protein